jgi:hypothetical protein
VGLLVDYKEQRLLHCNDKRFRDNLMFLKNASPLSSDQNVNQARNQQKRVENQGQLITWFCCFTLSFTF